MTIWSSIQFRIWRQILINRYFIDNKYICTYNTIRLPFSMRNIIPKTSLHLLPVPITQSNPIYCLFIFLFILPFTTYLAFLRTKIINSRLKWHEWCWKREGWGIWSDFHSLGISDIIVFVSYWIYLCTHIIMKTWYNRIWSELFRCSILLRVLGCWGAGEDLFRETTFS